MGHAVTKRVQETREVLYFAMGFGMLCFFFQENEIFFQNTHINSTIERQTRCKFYNVILCTLSYYIYSENHMVHHITCDQYNEKVQTLMKAST